MYHSLIISGKNTYETWGMVPTSRPVVNPPEVRTTQVDLPAADGVLDYTELLTGRVPYGQRTGSWEFTLRPGVKWVQVYTSLLNELHGLQHTIVLEDDPRFQYTGRLSVSAWKSDPSRTTVTIDYNLSPYRQSIHASDDQDWLWDDAFTETIRYGSFAVAGEKWRNFINEGGWNVTPVFTCSAAMEVEYRGSTYNLIPGQNANANLALQPGDNIMVFRGNGTVSVHYREVSL